MYRYESSGIWGTPICQYHYVESTVMISGVWHVDLCPVKMWGSGTVPWGGFPSKNLVIEGLVKRKLSTDITSLNVCGVSVHDGSVDDVELAGDIVKLCWAEKPEEWTGARFRSIERYGYLVVGVLVDQVLSVLQPDSKRCTIDIISLSFVVVDGKWWQTRWLTDSY